ncbi:hypothetical protein CU026_1573 [Enterococcus faecium]|nr:hypothetical protein EfmE1071_2647 [Enterococcus faecium E1071]EFF23814.1 hypothetical protein EfmE1636_0991 [Enterococcus faecium E1636]EFF26475.1 hypothetical protein EfmE1679_1494 [Enterococcus faecium E1679]EFF28127.1 hypothetical protein EfmU0317_2931 [Enterococcus faecium U0317]EFF32485.1 hypothetical protein EfmE1039_1048 [Enterococcus faecium E1039]EFF33869.1 hypothetical protein EfmE1162_2434 [Enterococcus faecium E1162]MBK4750498.1 hypothetical protein [Enterococcus faecium]
MIHKQIKKFVFQAKNDRIYYLLKKSLRGATYLLFHGI